MANLIRDEQKQRRKEDQSGAEIHIGNNWLRLFGLDITHILVVTVIILVGLGLWQHSEQSFQETAKREQDSKKSFLDQHAVTQKMLGEIIVKLDQGAKQAERAAYMQTYVLTLDEKERKALKLAMPLELRNGYQPPR